MTETPTDPPQNAPSARLSAAAHPAATHNQPEYTVGELSHALKRMVEGEFGHVRVRGEISGFKRAASGHLYMALKDEEAVLDAVCWRGVAGRLSLAPEDGMEVVATGRLTTYPGRSKYQIVIEALELAGEGALLKLLEDRRKKLAAEGLFDAERKKPLPFLPEVIGVITSPTGAVIRDILHRLAERFPRRVLLWPVLVQGEAAPEQIAAAIDGFNRLPTAGGVPRPDVLIVARGGGSLEDLWAFNEEIVVRAAAASDIPLISAVGHETDTTLIDHAADLRAPTPTAAAEKAVPVRAELLAQVLDQGRRIVSAANRMFEERRLRVESLSRGLPDPRSILDSAAQRLDDRAERLANAARSLLSHRSNDLERIAAGLRPRALEDRVGAAGDRVSELATRLPGLIRRTLAEAGTRLANAGSLLESFSYQRVLERGFALVRDGSGAPVISVAGAKPGAHVAIRFHDGEADARITGTKKAETKGPPAKRAPAKRVSGPGKPKKAGDQGSLF